MPAEDTIAGVLEQPDLLSFLSNHSYLVTRQTLGVGQHQHQMQVRLGDSRYQFGSLECEAFGVLRIHHHQNATDRLHGRLPENE